MQYPFAQRAIWRATKIESTRTSCEHLACTVETLNASSSSRADVTILVLRMQGVEPVGSQITLDTGGLPYSNAAGIGL